MIKPYYKEKHDAKTVEVEDFGIIDLADIPIRVRKDQKGIHHIDWVSRNVDGKNMKFLAEHGGSTGIDYGGRELGVIRKL